MTFLTVPSLFCIGYLSCVQLLRYRRREEQVRRFREAATKPAGGDDPEVARQIQATIAFFEFPLISRLSLEFALFRTYALPSISTLLEKTKSFTNACGARYDDTDLLISEVTQNPLDSKRSVTAIRRINAIHNMYKGQISNEDMIYVLSVFIFEPIRWIETVEWRTLTPEECQASLQVWTDIGERMGIDNIPKTLDEYSDWNVAYEKQHIKYKESNAVIGGATIALFLSLVPSFARPFGRRLAYCLMDERLRVAMGYPNPDPMLQRVVDTLLYCRKICLRYACLPRPNFLSARRTPVHGSSNNDNNAPLLLCPRFHVYERTYPHGYVTENLGTAPRGKLMMERPKWK